ncbi:hypothetical protein ERJ75_000297200 [Trypanosoma vivax]|nr:hypothetical protein ERJ75_000297200 [Trypanosoma vivax]
MVANACGRHGEQEGAAAHRRQWNSKGDHPVRACAALVSTDRRRVLSNSLQRGGELSLFALLRFGKARAKDAWTKTACRVRRRALLLLLPPHGAMGSPLPGEDCDPGQRKRQRAL